MLRSSTSASFSGRQPVHRPGEHRGADRHYGVADHGRLQNRNDPTIRIVSTATGAPLFLPYLGDGVRDDPSLRVGGGGAHTRLLGQLKAELLGLRVLHLDLDPAGFGVVMLAASAAGMPGEATAAIAAAVARALVLRPTRSGRRGRSGRFEWFARTSVAAAVHRPEAVHETDGMATGPEK